MELKTFQREFRNKLKEEGKKVVISKETLKLTVYPNAEKKEYYSATVKREENEKTLIITNLEQKGRIASFEAVYYLFYYWIGYASSFSFEKITFDKKILAPRTFWGYANKMKEERVDFLPRMGFVIDENSYHLEIKNTKEVLPVYQKITHYLKEKTEKEKTMNLSSQSSDREGVIYRGLLNWLGHKDFFKISYDLIEDNYVISDQKISIKAKEEELEEKMEEYFGRIQKMRKIKNIYEPPTDNLKRLMQVIPTVSNVSFDSKILMNMLLEKGYKNMEVEEEAVSLLKDPYLKDKVVRIGHFRAEAFFRFLNHYIMVHGKVGPVWGVKIFDEKEEMFEYYHDLVNKDINKLIGEKKEKI